MRKIDRAYWIIALSAFLGVILGKALDSGLSWLYPEQNPFAGFITYSIIFFIVLVYVAIILIREDFD